MQAHRVRRKRKARRRPNPCLGLCYGIRGVRCPYIERDNPERLPPLQGNSKFKIKKSKAMNKSKIIETLVKVVVAALTAFLTAITTTSFPLRGRLGSLEEPLNVAPAPQRRASPSLATEETERGLPLSPPSRPRRAWAWGQFRCPCRNSVSAFQPFQKKQQSPLSFRIGGLSFYVLFFPPELASATSGSRTWRSSRWSSLRASRGRSSCL